MRSALRVTAGVAVVATVAGVVGSSRFASAARNEQAVFAPEMWGQGLLSTPWD